MIKVSVISFICLLIVSLSGCATNTYVLKRINQIDQDYQSGKITYKERQIKLTELQDELETRQRWANACKGIGDVFLEKSRSTKSEKETYYIYDDPYSATPVGKIEKK